ncbi:maleylpyruvate isomerase family mycothiol-dependent enzyme [Enemella dayhoffiae]|nr:maleylpyruvate isomerase family mycothiol-dependent enzyme [Enemella dayhoffiae]
MEPIGASKNASLLAGDLNRLDRETEMLLATVSSLSEDELRAPSRCDGWTRAHVIAHLIGNAGGLANLIQWARTGEEVPMYFSRESRDADIAERSGWGRQQLAAELRAASDQFRAAAVGLREGVSTEVVTARFGGLSAWAIPALRISEVLVHHYDLDTVWGLDEADLDAQEDALELLVGMSSAQDWGEGVRLVTDEGEEHVLGEGAVTLRGERAALLAWLARGSTDGVRAEGDLPPSRGLG